MRTILLVTAAILIVAATPRPTAKVPVRPQKEATVSLQLTSPAFAAQATIPKRFTCDGEDVSPPLAWTGAPAGTRSFALIVDDPDAPIGIWVHWVLYDLPAAVTALPEAATVKNLPPGTREGTNGWKRTGYGGPCPPSGRHRYFHKLYALDIVLPDLNRPTKGALEKAMAGHVLAQTELVGTYQRSR
jgi:Raf kinase inhibitor-like YbhB/YbcL family protein